MKILKRIILWIGISLAFQFLFLFYLDRYYFGNSSDIKIKKDTKAVSTKKSNIKINIPENAKDTAISYNGKFVAYNINGVINIVNTKTEEVSKIEQDKNYELSSFKWFPDRDMLLIAEKGNGKVSGFKFFKYNLGRKEKEVLLGTDHKNPIVISTSDKKASIEDMEMSTLNNELYIKVKQLGKRSSIYKVDVNSNLYKVRTNSFFIGKMLTIPHKENSLVYEDISNNRIICESKKGNIFIKGVAKPRLLGIDSDDKVYIGNLKDDVITDIYYGDLNKSTDTWEHVNLKTPLQSENIAISSDDKIYLNDSFHGIVKNAKTSLETHYNGVFLSFYKGGIASVSGSGRLEYKTLK